MAGAYNANATCARWHDLFVADLDIAITLFFAFGYAATRLAGHYSRSVLAATVASATAARNAVRKCGDSSDMTLTVATSKANRAGNPIAVVRSVGSGRYDLP